MLSGLGQTRAHGRVPAAVPMDGEHGLASGIVHIGDNLCNQRADDSLLDVHVCVLRVPDGVEVACEGVEPFRSDERHRDFNLIPPQFDAQELDTGQRLVPPQLELARNQPIVRIHGLIAARCQLDLVFRVLKCLAFDMERLIPLALDKCGGRRRRSDGMRLDDSQHLLGNRLVRPQCAKADAVRETAIAMRQAARVTRILGAVAGIRHSQPLATPRAPQQPRQERPSTTR